MEYFIVFLILIIDSNLVVWVPATVLTETAQDTRSIPRIPRKELRELEEERDQSLVSRSRTVL